jgi:hypothetical protein
MYWQMDGWIDGRINVLSDGWIHGMTWSDWWIDNWMDELADGWMDPTGGLTNGWSD